MGKKPKREAGGMSFSPQERAMTAFWLLIPLGVALAAAAIIYIMVRKAKHTITDDEDHPPSVWDD